MAIHVPLIPVREAESLASPVLAGVFIDPPVPVPLVGQQRVSAMLRRPVTEPRPLVPPIDSFPPALPAGLERGLVTLQRNAPPAPPYALRTPNRPLFVARPAESVTDPRPAMELPIRVLQIHSHQLLPCAGPLPENVILPKIAAGQALHADPILKEGPEHLAPMMTINVREIFVTEAP